MTRWDLGPLLAPRSIAIVGASESPDSWAPEIERSLRHVGFEGELYPVNPKYAEVWGRRCRASVAELPRGVDLAVIVVPARVAVRMVDECGAAGVRSVMVVSSGFAEAGDVGRALQAELRETALRHRLPVLGPNVEGFVNYVERVAPYGTTPPPEPVAGSISVISQSGTVAWTMNQLASDRGAGLRIILGVGNEAVLGLGDLFAWAAGRSTHEGDLHLHRDDAGRGRDRARAGRAPRRAQADPGLCPGRAERGGAAIDRGAHRRARRQHGAPRCLAPRARRDPRGGSGDDVRGGAAALVRHADANERCRGGAAVRWSVHPVRRGGGREGPGAPGVLGDDQATAAEGVAALRVAEQPARRDRTGRRRDGHVL